MKNVHVVEVIILLAHALADCVRRVANVTTITVIVDLVAVAETLVEVQLEAPAQHVVAVDQLGVVVQFHYRLIRHQLVCLVVLIVEKRVIARILYIPVHVVRVLIQLGDAWLEEQIQHIGIHVLYVVVMEQLEISSNSDSYFCNI